VAADAAGLVAATAGAAVGAAMGALVAAGAAAGLVGAIGVGWAQAPSKTKTIVMARTRLKIGRIRYSLPFFIPKLYDEYRQTTPILLDKPVENARR
jgi:O-antigen/teichoic acid export membrane protein